MPAAPPDSQDVQIQERRTHIGYESQDGVFLVTFTNALGHQTTQMFHPGLGVLTGQMDPNGVLTRW